MPDPRKRERLLFRDATFIQPAGSSAADVTNIGDAMLAEGDRIVAVGVLNDLAPAASGARTISLDGATVVPGLADSHVHLEAVGRELSELSLESTGSKDDCLRRVKQAAASKPAGEWIIGRGFNMNLWPDPTFPTAADLDAVAPHHPVLLVQFDGHCIWVNSAAMKASNITHATPVPTGGRISRDQRSNPSGMFFEHACALLSPPQPTRQQRLAYVRAGVESFIRFGYTAVHSVCTGGHAEGIDTLHLLAELYPDNTCPLRVFYYPMIEELSAALDHRKNESPDSVLRVAGIKAFLDGSLNSHTCWMLEPFEGSPGNTGVPVLTPEQLRDQIRRCNSAGLPLACHAIGDRAVRELLDAYEQVGTRGLANRIEHAQHLHPLDIPRFAKLGIIASMQTSHLMTDWRTADRILGYRARYAFAVRSLLDAGATVLLGSDAPVVSADPRDSLLSATQRVDRTGNPASGWHPEERITAAQWLTLHTTNPAKAVGQQDRLGYFAPGHQADFTAFDQNPFAQNAPDPRTLQIRFTCCGGQLIHSG